MQPGATLQSAVQSTLRNFKPDDRAVIVKGTNLDVIVRMEDVSQSYGPPCWRVPAAWPVRCWYPDGTSAFLMITSSHDARPRPIRPAPTSDARPADQVIEDPAQLCANA